MGRPGSGAEKLRLYKDERKSIRQSFWLFYSWLELFNRADYDKFTVLNFVYKLLLYIRLINFSLESTYTHREE